MSEITPSEISRREALKRGLKVVAGSALAVAGSSKVSNSFANGDDQLIAGDPAPQIAKAQASGIGEGVAVATVGSELMNPHVRRSRRLIIKAAGAVMGLEGLSWKVNIARKKST